MGHFTVIEYTGKDSAEVLSRITGGGKGQEIEIVDTDTHHPIGFVYEPQEPEEADSD